MKNVSEYFISKELTVSIAGENDKDSLVKLINHAFAYQDEAKGDVRISPTNLTKKMQNSDFYVWKDSSKKIVACCYVESLPDKVHFGLLCVTDQLRGTGLAKNIIKSIEKYGRGRGNKTAELDYMSLSPWLKRYYETLGYKETGEVEDIEWCALVRMHKSI